MNIDAQFNETGGIFHADIGEEREISDVEQIRAEISTSRAEDKKLYNNLYANALRSTASGETINLTDVSPNEHTLNVKIHSKNLWQHTGEPAYINRASYESDTHLYTVNKSGVLWYPHTFPTPIPKNTAVSVTVEVISGNGAVSIGGQHKESGKKTWQGYVDLPQNTDLSGKTYTASFITDDTVTDLCIFADVNSTIAEPVIFRVQYELGSTATPYTPYISDLTSVNVTACGKNLIPYPYAETTNTISGIIFTDNGDGTITANGTATANVNYELQHDNAMFSLPAGNYFLSGCPAGGSTTTYFMVTANGAGISYDKFIRDFGNGVTVSSKGEKWKVSIRIMSGTTVNNLVFKPQLELGSTATAYEPYQAPTIYTPTSDGTVEDVTSISPDMTLMTDTAGITIDCEYNRDINKAFAELQQAIISSGGNI